MVEQPTRFGRYEVVRLLGKGAMAFVYLCRDPLLERDVAIKVIRIPPWMSEEELETYRERFFREAKTAGKLHHPNIVTIHDMGIVEETGVPYIVMEYVPGETLKQRIKKYGRLKPAEAVNIILQVAHALSYAHEYGIIHRDIKPANIIITPAMIPKLSDFGIAHITGSELTTTGQFIGSPSYMSPEQAMGKHPTVQSDLFSLGIVFYECLSGEKPFKGETISQITFQLLNDTYPSISNLIPELPDKLVHIVQKLMARNAQDRYASADELIKDLEYCQMIHPELRLASPLPEQTLIDYGDASAYQQLKVAPESTVDLTRLPLIIRFRRMLLVFLSKIRDGMRGFSKRQPSPLLINGFLLLLLIGAVLIVLVRTGRESHSEKSQGMQYSGEPIKPDHLADTNPFLKSEQSGTVEAYTPVPGTKKTSPPARRQTGKKKCPLRVYVKFSPFRSVHIIIRTKDEILDERELRGYFKSIVGKMFPVKQLVREGVVQTQVPQGTEEVIVEISHHTFGRRIRFPLECKDTHTYSASVILSKEKGKYHIHTSWRRR